MDTCVHLLLNVVKIVFVQDSLLSALHMNNAVGCEYSQCIKIDYLLIRANK